MTFKKRQQINTTCTICSNEVEMVIKNNVWIYVRWKKKKNRNEYSLATVYNPQGNTPTLTQADREREGEKKVGETNENVLSLKINFSSFCITGQQKEWMCSQAWCTPEPFYKYLTFYRTDSYILTQLCAKADPCCRHSTYHWDREVKFSCFQSNCLWQLQYLVLHCLCCI